MPTPRNSGGRTHQVSLRSSDSPQGSDSQSADNDVPAHQQLEATTPAEEPMVELQVPANIEPPTMGLPAWRFKRNIKKNREDPIRPGYVLVPAPNSKELAARRERDYVALTERSKQRLIDLTQERQRAIVVFVNSKGNGATTTSVIWTITGLCIETGSETTAFDGNFSSGTVAQRLRLEGDRTISERQLADHLEEMSRTHGSFNEYVRNNTDRVRVIGAKSTIEGGRKLTNKEYAAVAQAGFDNCDYMFVDTPNEISGDQCLALLNMADLIVFTANIGEQDSLRQLGTSMQTLRSFAVDGVSLADKVNSSVVLFNNMQPGDQVKDYLKYLNEVNMANEVTRNFPGHVGPCVGIRHDRAMAHARPVHYTELQRETAQDIRMFNITVLEQLPLKERPREFKRSVNPLYSPQHSTPHQEGGAS